MKSRNPVPAAIQTAHRLHAALGVLRALVPASPKCSSALPEAPCCSSSVSLTRQNFWTIPARISGLYSCRFVDRLALPLGDAPSRPRVTSQPHRRPRVVPGHGTNSHPRLITTNLSRPRRAQPFLVRREARNYETFCQRRDRRGPAPGNCYDRTPRCREPLRSDGHRVRLALGCLVGWPGAARWPAFDSAEPPSPDAAASVSASGRPPSTGRVALAGCCSFGLCIGSSAVDGLGRPRRMALPHGPHRVARCCRVGSPSPDAGPSWDTSRCPGWPGGSPSPDADPSWGTPRCPGRRGGSPSPDAGPSWGTSRCPRRRGGSPSPDTDPSWGTSLCPGRRGGSPSPDTGAS